jgi:5-methylcytosine-specific restriction endonuclease McrA
VKVDWFKNRFAPRATAVETICAVCERAMWLPKSKLAMYRTCGSEACITGLRSRGCDARRRDCETCANSFVPRQWQLNNGGGRFCSQQCNTIAHGAITSPETLQKAHATLREMNAQGKIRRASGEENPRWAGGRKASVARRIASGKSAESCRQWRRNNPDKSRGQSKRRRLKVAGRLATGTIERIGTMQRWRCAICRASIRAKYQLDHITPLALGGLHEARNIQLLCGPCNMRKNAKDPIRYMQEIGRLL